MKLNKYLFVIILFFGCKVNDVSINNIKNAESLPDQFIAVSCTRCGCIDEFLEYANDNNLLTVPVLADSSCFQDERINFKQFNTSSLDSLVEDNYNAVLLRREGKRFVGRILRTEESSNFKKYIEEFFVKK